MWGRRAFGKKISRPDAAALGLDPGKAYRLVLKDLGMGSSNAPDITQLAHETLLQRAGCLGPDITLRYGSPLPAGGLLEGVYLDDHVVVAMVPLSQAASDDGGPSLSPVTRRIV